MAAYDSGSRRSLTVLAVVVACFAVLWPKVFYPMVQSIVFPSEVVDEDEHTGNTDIQIMLNSQMRESMGEARPHDNLVRDKNRALFHSSIRQFSKPHTKGAGAVNLVVPVYSIAIILFFIYTLIKVLLKKFNEEGQFFTNDFHQNANLSRPKKLDEILVKKKESSQEMKVQRVLEQYGKHKVLSALKTIIFEMEEFKENLVEVDRSKSRVNEADATCLIREREGSQPWKL